MMAIVGLLAAAGMIFCVVCIIRSRPTHQDLLDSGLVPISRKHAQNSLPWYLMDPWQTVVHCSRCNLVDDYMAFSRCCQRCGEQTDYGARKYSARWRGTWYVRPIDRKFMCPDPPKPPLTTEDRVSALEGKR